MLLHPLCSASLRVAGGGCRHSQRSGSPHTAAHRRGNAVRQSTALGAHAVLRYESPTTCACLVASSTASVISIRSVILDDYGDSVRSDVCVVLQTLRICARQMLKAGHRCMYGAFHTSSSALCVVSLLGCCESCTLVGVVISASCTNHSFCADGVHDGRADECALADQSGVARPCAI